MDRWRSNQWQQGWLKRSVVTLIAILAIVFGLWGKAAWAADSEITVYRDPACGCCKGWIAHLQTQGFQVHDIETPQMEAIKQQHGVPAELSSCHTGLISGYAIEGHVPGEDIKQLIRKHPDVAGITVPGMPIGTPGMEDDDRRDSFTVYSFGQHGVENWNHYAF